MRFVKTRSLIYTPFHKEARYLNFEIGYAKESKWLEYVNDKWTNFANFFVAGYFEAVYTVYEKGSPVTYVQIEAKAIDYDARFRHPGSSLENIKSSPASPSTSVFAQRRDKLSSPQTLNRRNDSSIMEDDDVIITEDMQEEEISDKEYDLDEENVLDEDKDGDKSTIPHKSKKKRKLSDMCASGSETDEKNQSYNKKESRSGRGGRGRGGRGGRGRGRGGRK
jgi:hypothetical protein